MNRTASLTTETTPVASLSLSDVALRYAAEFASLCGAISVSLRRAIEE